MAGTQRASQVPAMDRDDGRLCASEAEEPVAGAQNTKDRRAALRGLLVAVAMLDAM